jgi:hypothetical protein
MKKLALLSAIAISGLFYNTANAQIRIHLGINLFPHHIYVRSAVVVQPAPVVYTDDAPADYNNDDDYYYLPDVNAYYNVSQQCYYYNDGDNWISAAYLPGEYRNYDWRNARRYEVRASRPYMHNDLYMNRYHGANYNWGRRDDHFKAGYADHFNDGGFRRDDQHFDNRGGYGQHFDNRNQGDNRNQNYNQQNGNDRSNRDGQQYNQDQHQNRGNDRGQQPNQNQDRGNRGGDQQHIAQNNGGHSGFGERRF